VHAEVGIRCPACAPPRRQVFGNRGLLAGGGGTILLVIVVAAVAALLLRGGGRGRSSNFGGFDPPTAEAIPFGGVAERSLGDPAALRLTSFTCARIEAFGATACEGSVQNISESPLQDVQFVVEWLTEGGDVVSVNRGTVEFNPVLPGQVSPWVLNSASYNPEFRSYRLTFEGADGPILVENLE
jgi:hypothetical protein